jgi:hypothetical protein
VTAPITIDSGLARPEEISCKSYLSAEQQLEAAIQAASDRMCAAPERADKLRHWREMVRLMEQRTPERVRFMERVRGLA